MKILIINGPNLNMLGKREPEIYGSQSWEGFFDELAGEFKTIQLDHFQSNHEGELIDKIQAADAEFDGIVLNAGGYTHTSVAIADAVASISKPVVEVHISNIYARESFRHHSYLTGYCKGIISGFGLMSYRLALIWFTQQK